ncbi:hypothetical protein QBC33DRAFT_93341 [Phialemonium atrogriseum]|uniref:Uncharacterized protein n=1 Tax=Phialemonium atrogriseum TaxID=1093897 RepID=A0AAJ0C1F1_9PEZI|nr:uncharacterized protein QBC33DRAFT_93341 [Phialemonium atrogriseum]KAK1766912.1 hypothetical protein QBC33DRAFT_93341 [Phialemonium atrogriseum]
MEDWTDAKLHNHHDIHEEDEQKEEPIRPLEMPMHEPVAVEPPLSIRLPPTQPSIAKNGLHILSEVFRLGHHYSRSPSLLDVVLIAIDFENINTIKSGISLKDNCQVGLAILDTREIYRVSPSRLIVTHNMATGSPSYLMKASRKFIFGETITIRPSYMAGRIQSLIITPSSECGFCRSWNPQRPSGFTSSRLPVPRTSLGGARHF